MTRIMITLLTISTFIFTACEPTVDATSEESMKASIQKIKDTLPEDKKEEFGKAVLAVSFSDFSFAEMMAGTQDGASLVKGAKEKLNGKTADEIFEMVDDVRNKREKEESEREAKRRTEQIEQAKADIAELEKAKQQSEAARSALANFEVKNSKFYMQRQRYGRDKPIIELEVLNNTSTPVSRAYFKGTYATPGRSIPWIEETFNHEISGGLEPGESAKWSLAPNMFSDWGSVEERDDAVFTVEVIKLDGPGGEALFEVTFDEDAAQRLKALKEIVGKLSTE